MTQIISEIRVEKRDCEVFVIQVCLIVQMALNDCSWIYPLTCEVFVVKG